MLHQTPGLKLFLKMALFPDRYETNSLISHIAHSHVTVHSNLHRLLSPGDPSMVKQTEKQNVSCAVWNCSRAAHFYLPQYTYMVVSGS